MGASIGWDFHFASLLQGRIVVKKKKKKMMMMMSGRGNLQLGLGSEPQLGLELCKHTF
jgi:hypothetical protein